MRKLPPEEKQARRVARGKRYKEEHKAELQARHRHYKETHREELREKARKYRLENLDAELARSRKRKYGLTIEQGEAMMVAQNQACPICQQPLTLLTSHVDHDHESNIIRGLLCGLCNLGLGAFRDNPNLLSSRIAYLQKVKEEKS